MSEILLQLRKQNLEVWRELEAARGDGMRDGVLQRLQAQNFDVWQEIIAARSFGEEIAQRWLQGAMPEPEFLAMVRDQLFGPFAPFTRRAPLAWRDVPHPLREDGVTITCAEGRSTLDLVQMVRWSTTMHPGLSRQEWATWERLREAAAAVGQHPWLQPAGAAALTLEQRSHRGVCHTCNNSVAHQSVLVRICWAGRTLSREYLL